MTVTDSHEAPAPPGQPTGRARARDHLAFRLPAEREPAEPPEERGLARDEVRLLVARPDRLSHTRFHRLGDHVHPGDLLVVNTSPTMPAALDGRHDGRDVAVHLSTRHDDGRWVLELRRPDGAGPVTHARPGEEVELRAGGRARLLAPDGPARPDGSVRLWRAELDLPGPVHHHLARHGRPIGYGHRGRDLVAHQTVFARLPRRGAGRLGAGASAEMASAARPFAPQLVTELVARGVTIAPITLHAGVSSLERHEPPRPEPFEVSSTTADLVLRARRRGGRVIAVGTTVTRALETVAEVDGTVSPGRGWTDLVLGPDHPARVVDGLVTGWHDAAASHLLLLEAVAGPHLVRRAYAAALAGPYLWHEFGDSCLLLP